MRYFDMFAGVGGFALAITRAYGNNQSGELIQGTERRSIQPERDQSMLEVRGHEQSEAWGDREFQQPENIGYSEIDKYAIQIYEKHFNHKNYGDATTIDPSTIPDFDLLVGGFPCQAFSVAGKRKGFDDTRGTLFFDIARILAEKRPRYLVLENVKGLLSHDNGKTFQTILGVLTDLGYELEWQVLNSKDFGVPQNRERVFIIGYFGGGSRPKVFPFGQDDSGVYEQEGEFQRKIQTAQCLTARYYKMACTDNYIVAQRGRYNEDGTTSQQLEARNDNLTNTLTSVQKDNLVNGIRRLTPTECERLQGFPDGWTEGVSDTQRYKCLGNAVTVNVVQAIIEKLFDRDHTNVI